MWRFWKHCSDPGQFSLCQVAYLEYYTRKTLSLDYPDYLPKFGKTPVLNKKVASLQNIWIILVAEIIFSRFQNLLSDDRNYGNFSGYYNISMNPQIE